MLKSLELTNLRNFADAKFNFSRQTAILGVNGSGKTTILEAIRLLSVGKSFRSSILAEAIRFDQPFFRLIGFLNKDKEKKAEYFFGFSDEEQLSRQLKFEGKPISWLDYLGTLPTVLLLSSDLEIILGEPRARRHYLDGVLFQTDRQFRFDHLEVSRVLRERAALLLLMKLNRAGADELQPWDDLLLSLTEKIRHQRQQYLDFINEQVEKLNSQLKPKVKIKFRYQTEPGDLENLRSREIRLAQNLFGPHRDEIIIDYDNRLARRFASRGQARLILVVLKAAEAAYLTDKLGSPTVLLDDIFSEFDAARAMQALSLFAKYQSVLTATESRPAIKGWQQIELGKK